MQRRTPVFVVFFILFGLLSCNSTNSIITPDYENHHYVLTDGDYSLMQWFSRENPQPSELKDNDTIEGDRIRVISSFPNNNEGPEDDVVKVNWIASSGFVERRNGSLVIPYDGYEPFVMGLEVDQLAWERIEGINMGDNVHLTCYFNNTDTDVLVYWADYPNSTWYTDSGLTARQLVTGAPYEDGFFVANRAGAIMVGMYSYDHQPGTYNLIVDTTEEENGEVVGNVVEYATWSWQRNITLSLEFTATTSRGQLIKRNLNNVTFNNFFSPQINDVEVAVDGILRYITWHVTDRNMYEFHRFEIRYSIDDGQTYQLIASNISSESYVWNTAGFDEHKVCVVKITAIDASRLRTSMVSSEFSIGAVAEFTGSFWYSTSSSGNTSYILGSENNTVSWRVWIENHIAIEYEILIDEDVIRTGWTSGEELTVDADCLSVGIHQFTLSLSIANERRNHTVYIEVLPDPHQTVVQTISSAAAGFVIMACLIVIEMSKRERR